MNLGILDSDMILEYIKRRSPIVQGLDGRIKVIKKNSNQPHALSACKQSGSIIMPNILFM